MGRWIAWRSGTWTIPENPESRAVCSSTTETPKPRATNAQAVSAKRTRVDTDRVALERSHISAMARPCGEFAEKEIKRCPSRSVMDKGALDSSGWPVGSMATKGGGDTDLGAQQVRVIDGVNGQSVFATSCYEVIAHLFHG